MDKQTGYPQASAAFDWLFVIFSGIWIAGLYIDGWAHNHINHIETFFTPWHAILYGGFLLTIGLLVAELLRNHSSGYPWISALPRNYRFALAGAAIFLLSGVGDLIWHTIFGIEAGLDALLSPTHLAGAIAGAMTVSGPLRAIWYSETKTDKIPKIPVAVSFLIFFSILMFMVIFFNPYYLPLWMSHVPGIEVRAGLEQTFHRELGIADAILYSSVFLGILLSTIRHFKFPFGSFTLILGVNALATAFADGGNYWAITAGFVAGFTVDIIYYKLFDRLNEPGPLRVFGLLVPVAITSSYAAATLLTMGTWWSIHFVLGYVVIAGIAGWLITYLLLPPSNRYYGQFKQ